MDTNQILSGFRLGAELASMSGVSPNTGLGIAAGAERGLGLAGLAAGVAGDRDLQRELRPFQSEARLARGQYGSQVRTAEAQARAAAAQQRNGQPYQGSGNGRDGFERVGDSYGAQGVSREQTVQAIDPLRQPLIALGQARGPQEAQAAMQAYLAAASRLPQGLDTNIPVNMGGYTTLLDFRPLGGAAVAIPSDGTISPRELAAAAYGNNPQISGFVQQSLGAAPAAVAPAASAPGAAVTHRPDGGAVRIDDQFRALPPAGQAVALINAPQVLLPNGQPVSAYHRLDKALELSTAAINNSSTPMTAQQVASLLPSAGSQQLANNMAALYQQSSPTERTALQGRFNTMFDAAERRFPEQAAQIQAQQDAFNRSLNGQAPVAPAAAPAQPQTGAAPAAAPAGATPAPAPAAGGAAPAPATPQGPTAIPAAEGNRAAPVGVRAQRAPNASEIPAIAANQISALQQRIIEAGGSVGATGADGKYGPNTQAGVRAFAATLTPPITDLSTIDFTNAQDPEALRFNTALDTAIAARRAPAPAPVVVEPAPAQPAPAPVQPVVTEPSVRLPNVGIYGPANTANLPQEGSRDSRHGLAERGLRELGALSNGIGFGLLAEPVDGRPGQVTTGAIRKFQEQNHLPPTGVADPLTLQVIGIKIAAQNGTYNGIDPRRPVPENIVDAAREQLAVSAPRDPRQAMLEGVTLQGVSGGQQADRGEAPNLQTAGGIPQRPDAPAVG